MHHCDSLTGSLSAETMIAFLQLLQDQYGGVERYLERYAQLSPDDIQEIRRNLLELQS